MSNDFWEDMGNAFVVESAIDTHLQGRELQGASTTSMRELTDKARAEAALAPQPAGTRVAFKSNLGSLLTYKDCPEPDLGGTVVLVKTGEGKTTHLDGNMFVLWDDGVFRSIRAEHLRLAGVSRKTAQRFRVVVSNLGDLSGLFAVAGQSDELVHKATQDLWSLKKDGDNFVIERLFNETGKPLKV
jgi:hypothetical protein